MAYEAILNRPGLYRVLLEERYEGVYINAFSRRGWQEPFIDRLAPSLQAAKLGACEEFGITEEQWREVPDEPWHASPLDEDYGRFGEADRERKRDIGQ